MPSDSCWEAVAGAFSGGKEVRGKRVKVGLNIGCRMSDVGFRQKKIRN